MCQSIANGGQRCYTHAAARANRASSNLDLAIQKTHPPSGTAAPSEVDNAYGVYLEALTDLASTRRGKLDVEHLLQRGDISVALAHATIRDGGWRRQRNKLVQKVRRAGTTSGVVPATGDPHVDALIDHAIASIVKTPSAHGCALDDTTWIADSSTGKLASHGIPALTSRLAGRVAIERSFLAVAAADVAHARARQNSRAGEDDRIRALTPDHGLNAAVDAEQAARSSLAFWQTQLVRAALGEL